MKMTQRIATHLKRAFYLSLFLTSVMGSVSLFSWYQQDKQVNYVIDDYFPQVQQVFQLENAVQHFMNEFAQFSLLKSASSRQFSLKQLTQQLDTIDQLARTLLFSQEKDVFTKNIAQLRQLTEQLNTLMSEGALIEQHRQELITQVQWLNDDFNNEVLALLQELNWQQINLATQSEPMKSKLQAQLQQESALIYEWVAKQDQMKAELLQFLYRLNPEQAKKQFVELKHFVKISIPNEISQKVSPHIEPLRQMVESLFTLPDHEIATLVADFQHYQYQSTTMNLTQQEAMQQTHVLLEQILNQTKTALTESNSKLKANTKISGAIIGALLILSLLFIWLFNYFYIHRKITSRFNRLISSVKKLNKGEFDTPIATEGNDEISQISILLTRHIRLIQEKMAVQASLETTQEELIQAAKLAVVGQTMTSLAHEINQPLNAMSIYLFSLRKAYLAQYEKSKNDSKQPDEKIQAQFDNIQHAIDRITHIIKGLRQFTRKSETARPLQAISLRKIITESWNLLEFRHKPLNAQLIVQGEHDVLADDILLEQVFVNLLTNALEACTVEPIITVEIALSNGSCQVSLRDNGNGWQVDHADQLLKPFYTNKAVGLGLGLTISQTIMEKFNGSLVIASTLNHNAEIILSFPSHTE